MPDFDDLSSAVTGTIQTQLGDLFLESFTAVERLSEPFRISCDVVSASRVDLSSKLGGGASLTIHGGAGGVLAQAVDAISGGDLDSDIQMTRSFHGLVMEASEIEEFDGAFRYQLTLRPWLTLLQLNKTSRIFQHLSARDIIVKVFKDANIDTSRWDLKLKTRGLIVREYCVQYNESDFDFVSRIMEEEGIYYFFQHTADKHVMVLCDGPASHSAFVGGDVAYNDENASGPRFWSLTEHVKATPTLSTSRDTHFKKFGEVYAARSEKEDASKLISGEIYNYPGTHSYLTDDAATLGTDYAKLRLLAARAEKTRYLAEGEVFAVSVGSVLNIVPAKGDHAKPRDPVKILVTGAVHTFSGQKAYASAVDEGLVMRVSVEGTPSTDTWLPMLRTPRPVARGPQVATVAGPADDPIHIDEVDRVRVLFPWDRENKGDGDGSSCWLRVATSWAGNQFGALFLPRVGTEVLVDFLEGDMDRPFVSGAAYNSSNPAVTFHDHSDKHPEADQRAKAKTVSGWVTQTVYGATGQDYPNTVEPPSANKRGLNYLFFDDMAGNELVAVGAQRDMIASIRRDEMRWIGQDRNEMVGHDLNLEVRTGDETRTVTKGKRTTTIQQDDSLEVKEGNLITKVDKKNETHTVSQGTRTTSIYGLDKLTVTDGDRTVTVSKGNQSTEISQGNLSNTIDMGNVSHTLKMGNLDTTLNLGDASMKADLGSISYEAMQSIELKVGENSIKIDMMGVTINGIMVKITGEMMTQIDGGAMTTVKGAIVMIN